MKDDNAMSPPLFRREGDIWHPSPEAGGIRPGLHGGSFGALMAAACETRLRDMAASGPVADHPLTASFLFLRPVPIAPCRLTVETLRAGGRSTVLSVILEAEGKLCGRGHAVFGGPADLAGMPTPADDPRDPEAAVPFVPHNKPDRTYLGDVTDTRRDGDGFFWLRLNRPIGEGAGPMASTLIMADWSPGLSRPDGWTNPIAPAHPNIDLTVHFWRPPEGAWIGLRPKSRWGENGLGMTTTLVCDARGPFARCGQSVVAMPRGRTPG